MSDDSEKDRRYGKVTQAGLGALPHPKKRPDVRTVVGLPAVDAAAAARAGLFERGESPVREERVQAVYGRRATSEHEREQESDTRYVDPPSELLGRAQTERVATSGVPTPYLPQAPEPGLLGSALSSASEGSASGLYNAAMRGELSAPGSAAPRSPAPRLTTSQAPEAWRNDMRRVAQRGPVPQANPAHANRAAAPTAAVTPRAAAVGQTSAQAPKASLRLKLDLGATDEIHYKGVPKSPLPKVLFWLLVVGGAAGGGAYYVSEHGGIDSVVSRLRGTGTGTTPAPTLTTSTPTGPATPNAPPSSTAPAGDDAPAAQPAGTAATTPAQAPAQPAAAPQAAPPSAPAAPSAAPAAPSAPAAVADKPSGDAAKPAQPTAAKPARERAKPAAAAAKPKASKASSPAYVAPRSQDSVLTVRPLGSGPDLPIAPPDPSGASSVPMLPADPPPPEP